MIWAGIGKSVPLVGKQITSRPSLSNKRMTYWEIICLISRVLSLDSAQRMHSVHCRAMIGHKLLDLVVQTTSHGVAAAHLPMLYGYFYSLSLPLSLSFSSSYYCRKCSRRLVLDRTTIRETAGRDSGASHRLRVRLNQHASIFNFFEFKIFFSLAL